MKYWLIFLFSFCNCFFAHSAFAQINDFTGTWRMEYPSSTGSVIKLELNIATPQNSILFPAHIKLSCDSFVAEYEFLLVKKNIRQLAISKNKYPLYEKPFSLDNLPICLNGVFDYSRDLKGSPILTAIRMEAKKNPTVFPGLNKLSKKYISTALCLKEFFETDDVKLRKINDRGWVSDDCQRILSPTISPAYFGLLDTIIFRNRDGLLELTSSKKTDNDIVSVALNGRTIIDQAYVGKKKYSNECLLDTGLNLLALFAENFGDAVPNKGKLDIQFYYKKLSLDFNSSADSAANFIVAQLYSSPDTMRQLSFQEYIPTPEKKNLGTYDSLKKDDKLITSIVSTSRELTFAIWDDAVEDGDSVSIEINGKWLVQNMRVTKKTQFFTVLLKPGPNTIIFRAENLGSIPPNTSMMEIIDGKKRKSFNIETTVGENNLVRIFYDLQPDQQ
ncbi:hypothetical protein [Ferruginibacter albus]|uniref:hypothetical protein n=1 Tax=Ferruginibacter albus TaxID=2875540 RepID=UPI001CC5252D|nr:hypothetical protein [Ferruginibacter albus]UAY51102.1 hypothetical protein K9M53_10925 [Ferruginibacter albus]